MRKGLQTVLFLFAILLGGHALLSQTPRPAPPAGAGSGGTCAGLAGDVTGTCAATVVAKVNGNTPGVGAVSHQFVTTIDTSARGTLAQPACADLSNAGTGCSGAAPTTNQNIRTIAAHFDGGGSAISGTKTACMRTPYAGTITGWYIDGDVAGSGTFAVRSVAFGSYTGTAGFAGYTDVTGGGTAPVLTTAVTATFANLTSWVTTVTAGNEYCFQLTSPATATQLNVYLAIAAN